MKMQLLNLIDLMKMFEFEQGNLWDEFPLDNRLNRDILINQIIMLSGRSFPLYQDPRVFKMFLTVWFTTHQDNISKLYDTTVQDYNMIHNYDRTETTSRNIKRDGKSKDTGVSEEDTTNKGTSSIKGTTSASASNIHEVSPYDANAYVADNQDTSSSNGTNQTDTNDSLTVNTSGTDTVNREHSDSESDTATITSSGNIGVMSTQQMIQQERDIDVFNVYDWIAREIDRKLFYGLW